MLFNSYIFLFAFLPITLGCYWFTEKHMGKEQSFVLLVFASLIYYAYWKVAYLGLILGSIGFNYLAGLLLSNGHSLSRRKFVLTLGVTVNLSLLAYYKYTDFFLESLSSITGSGYQPLNIILPLAISFFTFQQIAYLVDAYKGLAKEYSFVHYCLFICFFPQLIAGPIVHHKEMLPQFMQKARNSFNATLFYQGLLIIALGLFKKVVIADNIAHYSTPVFTAADAGLSVSFLESWMAKFAYAFQLYFDFSAYSDMALGIGMLFGITLPINFNSPYKAQSITEFWKRWHMTLSRFLRDYLYIPLGGNRKGQARSHCNRFATMVLGGLWHGASWNFVLWGALHGLYMALNMAWAGLAKRLRMPTQNRLYKLVSLALTFLVVIEAWVLFRAESFSGALAIYSASLNWHEMSVAMLTGEGASHIADTPRGLLMIIICAIIVFFSPNVPEFVTDISIRIKASRYTAGLQALLAGFCAALLVISIASMNQISEFLYFQF